MIDTVIESAYHAKAINLSDVVSDVKEYIFSLFKEQEIARLILFGSCARGDYNRLSDIDICVIYHSSLEKETPSWKIQMKIDGESIELFNRWLIPINIISMSTDEYERTKGYTMLSKDIEKEGILIWESLKETT